jgi:hypothetical protein
MQVPFFQCIPTYKIKSFTLRRRSATATLQLLRTLPDPDQDLFFQTLHEFTLFPQLPPEIRLQIWRDTFRKGVSHYIQRRADGSWLQWPPLPPISSAVNQESRQETLRHYQVLEEEEVYGLERFRVFWNKKDSIVGAFRSLVCDPPIYDRNFIDFAAAIGSVKIQLCYMCHNCYRARVFGHHDTALGYYMNLSELHVIDRYEDLRKRFGISRVRCIRKVRYVFEEIVAKDIKGSKFSIPKITVSSPSWQADELQD